MKSRDQILEEVYQEKVDATKGGEHFPSPPPQYVKEAMDRYVN